MLVLLLLLLLLLLLREKRSRALTALLVADSTSGDHYAALSRLLFNTVNRFHIALSIRSDVEAPAIRVLDLPHAQAALEGSYDGERFELHPTLSESGIGTIIRSCNPQQVITNAVTFGVRLVMEPEPVPTLF